MLCFSAAFPPHPFSPSHKREGKKRGRKSSSSIRKYKFPSLLHYRVYMCSTICGALQYNDVREGMKRKTRGTFCELSAVQLFIRFTFFNIKTHFLAFFSFTLLPPSPFSRLDSCNSATSPWCLLIIVRDLKKEKKHTKEALSHSSCIQVDRKREKKRVNDIPKQKGE